MAVGRFGGVPGRLQARLWLTQRLQLFDVRGSSTVCGKAFLQAHGYGRRRHDDY